MGHLGLAKKQYADALRMYELAARLNNQRDVKVGLGRCQCARCVVLHCTASWDERKVLCVMQRLCLLLMVNATS